MYKSDIYKSTKDIYKSTKDNISKFAKNSAITSEIYQKLSFKRKEYTFTTGEIEICQGYEHWSLRELEEEYEYTYTDYQNWNGLEFWYEYLNKKHRYYPDIPFLRENLIIEVKSEYTFYKE